MRLARWNPALLLLVFGGVAHAQDVQLAFGRKPVQTPYCPIPCLPDTAPTPSSTPMPDAAVPPTSAFSEALASAPEAGTQPGASYAPAFFGDLLGATGTKLVKLPDSQATRYAFAPIVRHAGAIKITDNESPQTADRVFYFFNEFSYVNFSSNTDLPPINLQRHVFGFEKTLLNGWASFGMRLPVVLTDGPPELTSRQFADMTLITKFVLWDDKRRGDLVSAGLAITVPTGETEFFTSPASGNQLALADTILQPYAGYIYSVSQRVYAHGFTALAVPTDSRDVTILFNDLGVGYWLLRSPGDSFVSGVVPTWELHVSTPLNRRGKQSTPIGFSDVVNMTWGLHVLLPRSILGGAVGIPLTGPKPYGVEAVARYELRF